MGMFMKEVQGDLYLRPKPNRLFLFFLKKKHAQLFTYGRNIDLPHGKEILDPEDHKSKTKKP